MRWTVGPLPSAVYWRRRALVLGGLLVVILLIANTCGGSGTSEAAGGDPRASGSTSHPPSTGGPASGTQAPVSPAATPPSTVAGPPPPSGSPSPALSATCEDSEIKVAARIESTSATSSKLVHGGTFSITMEISNVSQRSCQRDVGSVAEEITIKRGNTLVWSSGACGAGTAPAHDVRTFHPGDLITAHVRWNSWRIEPDPCRNAKSPAPNGTYQLFGHVGSDVSPATAFTIQS
ncbi:MAG TPA: hypothetical protein VKB69_11135 [Micromonosporaceae bacterium]|nr:hypothetical protein [Micromonosporaceae bacterium]